MRKLMIPVLVVALSIMLMSLFVIPEGERGIVIRFGRVLKDNNEIARIYEPGLHFKMPMFDSVKTLGGGNTLTAETLLERKVTDLLRSEIGSREISR